VRRGDRQLVLPVRLDVSVQQGILFI